MANQTNPISIAARESARQPTGEFGTQTHADAGIIATPALTLDDVVTDDDLDSARDTLGPDATLEEVTALAEQRAAVAFSEYQRTASAEPVFLPLPGLVLCNVCGLDQQAEIDEYGTADDDARLWGVHHLRVQPAPGSPFLTHPFACR